ncbi:hypothetical protein DV495_003686 [Geotrichum candidum]|uniref:uS12 prolyl 3,4-dihydroxylase n=1 Tax=Geotrichum candidum TaxID=1173061 RepID=A0A0J9XHE4_GEOCN|nr:hypothetical protein DV452_003438 [Geotrichum candidum]KAI9210677.1 hypothetical protein DS838_004435 [Geotrichum bryndzae]KAF5114328.1 hypothetical protein DV454_003025 [Geotrichum candidum]KAF5124898.1 hypothetical protein DV495_003686 [Geotrichum candidum]KAF7497655.1 hypothetical protein DV113_004312 [Geotrichum candidum]
MTSAKSVEEVELSNKRKLEAEADTSATKIAKIAEIKQSTNDVHDKFYPGLLSEDNREALKAQIAASEPYKHGVIPKLMNDDLLRKVRVEIMENLHFTKKETDIYKVFQTGDLRNLSGLESSELQKLQNLFELREALYSKEFRDHLSYVTGCGALSGTKQDLSINVYQKGCQLLTHDDVIGSRRISYILYLPNPDEEWVYPRYGGALRLYPTVKPNVPAKDWSLVIPPAWNQMAFFTVQPGLSFHDVEEVFVDKERMSISGWFHIPQKGEPDFIEGELEATEAKSSLQQLESAEVQEYDFPKKNYELVDIKASADDVAQTKENLEKAEFEDDTPLKKEDFEYLSKYINPTLLRTPSMKMLSKYFLDESAVEIRDFLNSKYAKIVKKAIDEVDINLDKSMPIKSSEVDALPFWKLAGPPHKVRYMYIDGREKYEDEVQGDKSKADFSAVAAGEKTTDADKKLAEISEMLQSNQFREWLSVISSLNPIAQRILIRRFRPGYDYTLATNNDGIEGEEEVEDKDGNKKMQAKSEMVLEGTLCLTPTDGWEDGELGGYELSMLGEDDEDTKELDPAVYRGSSTGDKKDQEDDDSVLLTCQCDWNVLSLSVRDSGILKFVKYVSGTAPGSRWDISGEWPIENTGDDSDEEED